MKGDDLRSGEDDLPDGFEHWLVKFSGSQDEEDAGAVEFAYAQMARAAGVSVPPTRLFETETGSRFFGVQRFDRLPGNRRLHMHTLGGLIHSDFRIPNCDYAVLLNVARQLTRNHEDVLECFRRMVFNVVAHNRDDHVKNFAFLMDSNGDWSVSPAFDLTFAHGPGGQHSMTINGEGAAPTREQCLQLAKDHDLAPKRAVGIVDQINEAVADWRTFASEADCSKGSVTRIAKALRLLR